MPAITEANVQAMLHFTAGDILDEHRDQPSVSEIEDMIDAAMDDVTQDLLRVPSTALTSPERRMIIMRIDYHYHQWFKSRGLYAASLSTEAGSVSHVHDSYLYWHRGEYNRRCNKAKLSPY